MPGGPGNQDWDAVKKEYDKLDLFIKQAMAQSPALFALVESGGKAAGEFAGMSPEEARAKLQPLLQALIGKIDEADGLVGEDLDYREMGPVIEQLLGTPEWSGEMEKRLIKATLWKHNRDKMLRSLGLSALSALGFLFATFATGGAAVFIGAAVGVGASATQAGLSIEDYYDKAKAREARTGNAQLDIMSQESVDSAFTQAVLDSALALIDVWGGVGAIRKLGSPAIQMLRAGEAGVKASAEMALKEGLRASDAAIAGRRDRARGRRDRHRRAWCAPRGRRPRSWPGCCPRGARRPRSCSPRARRPRRARRRATGSSPSSRRSRSSRRTRPPRSSRRASTRSATSARSRPRAAGRRSPSSSARATRS